MNIHLVAGLLPIVIVCFSYATYCIYHGGVFVKNKGWKTKEEWPKTYWVNLVNLLILGLISLFGIIDPSGTIEFLFTIAKLIPFIS